jgi:hypothetical protein
MGKNNTLMDTGHPVLDNIFLDISVDTEITAVATISPRLFLTIIAVDTQQISLSLWATLTAQSASVHSRCSILARQ